MRHKKIKAIVVSLLVSLASAVSFAQGASDDFTGKWKTAEGKDVVITKVGAGFIGEAIEKKIVILKDVNFSDGKWTATVFNPVKEVTADCELFLEGSNLKIVATKGLMSKTIYWTKEL
jgi:uncharacterized protein (DUF2147 family)